MIKLPILLKEVVDFIAFYRAENILRKLNLKRINKSKR